MVRTPPRSYGPRPPWWPNGEPWPPRVFSVVHDMRRARFARRAWWSSFLPLWFMVWLLAGRSGWFEAQTPSAAVRGAALLLVGALLSGLGAFALRRVAVPVADLIAAANRIARRDYTARVESANIGPRWVREVARAFNAMATELATQDETRRHLMADIAHELRTPLTIVQGKLEGLIDGVYPRDDERLTGLLDDTRVLSRLVDDLRTLATAESGALALVKEPTDLPALVADAATAVQAQAEGAGVRVQLQLPATDQSTPFSADPVRLREVLINLLVNAVRHTPSGGLVSVRLDDTPDGATIRVSDTGGGIAAGDLPRIFDRFYKGAGSAGSGLGLTIARSLVRAHGGDIRAESQAGCGATFVVTLPRDDAAS